MVYMFILADSSCFPTMEMETMEMEMEKRKDEKETERFGTIGLATFDQYPNDGENVNLSYIHMTIVLHRSFDFSN